jgi:hypothetical protein
MTLSCTVAISSSAIASSPLASQSCRTDAEFVRREAADAVLAAKRATELAPDDGDHLVANVEAISFVDQREIIDAGEQERTFGGGAPGIGQKMGKFSGEPRAVELPVSSSWLPR